MEKVIAVILLVLLLVGIVLGGASCTPSGRAFLNGWDYELQKVDDRTRYDTRKQVEDTCRAAIVSYEADRLIWEQYRGIEDAEQRSWADAAKMRANKAAVTYNEYFLKNSYVFEGNVPEDIRTELEILK